MPEMIAALFNDRSQAESALQALIASGIAPDRIVAAGVNEGLEISSISGFRTLSPDADIGSALSDLQLPEGDLRLFGRGLHQGLTLVAARVDRDKADEAVQRLEMFGPVNLDERSREWTQPAGENAAANVGAPLGAGISGGTGGGMSNTEALPGMGTLGDNSDDLGTADQRTGDQADDLASTTTAINRRDGPRSERPGINELGSRSDAPAPGGDTLERRLNRGSRVWAWASGDKGC